MSLKTTRKLFFRPKCKFLSTWFHHHLPFLLQKCLQTYSLHYFLFSFSLCYFSKLSFFPLSSVFPLSPKLSLASARVLDWLLLENLSKLEKSENQGIAFRKEIKEKYALLLKFHTISLFSNTRSPFPILFLLWMCKKSISLKAEAPRLAWGSFLWFFLLLSKLHAIFPPLHSLTFSYPSAIFFPFFFPSINFERYFSGSYTL